MALINQATKEIQLKIVYYGPPQGGKTTNLEKVHAEVDATPEAKGKLTSLATNSDRTLFFDFLPLETAVVRGYRTKFQLFTVPGQVIYNTTRQLVLRGVDGLVFVADSQYEKMEENVQTFANMIQNLETVNQNLDNIPYVLQYNKRDLPNAAPVDYLEFLLNNRDTQVPSFASSAIKGEGIFETLNMITRMLLHKLMTESTRKAA
jgi:signal recognition particle receptor subunit beta